MGWCLDRAWLSQESRVVGLHKYLILFSKCLVQLYGLSTSDQSICSGEMQERSEEVKTLAAGSSIGQQVWPLPKLSVHPPAKPQTHAYLHPHTQVGEA